VNAVAVDGEQDRDAVSGPGGDLGGVSSGGGQPQRRGGRSPPSLRFTGGRAESSDRQILSYVRARSCPGYLRPGGLARLAAGDDGQLVYPDGANRLRRVVRAHGHLGGVGGGECQPRGAQQGPDLVALGRASWILGRVCRKRHAAPEQRGRLAKLPRAVRRP